MAYEVHIERKERQPITLEDWVNAVGKVENVRLGDAAALIVTNPTTGR